MPQHNSAAGQPPDSSELGPGRRLSRTAAAASRGGLRLRDGGVRPSPAAALIAAAAVPVVLAGCGGGGGEQPRPAAPKPSPSASPTLPAAKQDALNKATAAYTGYYR